MQGTGYNGKTSVNSHSHRLCSFKTIGFKFCVVSFASTSSSYQDPDQGSQVMEGQYVSVYFTPKESLLMFAWCVRPGP